MTETQAITFAATVSDHDCYPIDAVPPDAGEAADSLHLWRDGTISATYGDTTVTFAVQSVRVVDVERTPIEAIEP